MDLTIENLGRLSFASVDCIVTATYLSKLAESELVLLRQENDTAKAANAIDRMLKEAWKVHSEWKQQLRDEVVSAIRLANDGTRKLISLLGTSYLTAHEAAGRVLTPILLAPVKATEDVPNEELSEAAVEIFDGEEATHSRFIELISDDTRQCEHILRTVSGVRRIVEKSDWNASISTELWQTIEKSPQWGVGNIDNWKAGTVHELAEYVGWSYGVFLRWGEQHPKYFRRIHRSDKVRCYKPKLDRLSLAWKVAALRSESSGDVEQ